MDGEAGMPPLQDIVRDVVRAEVGGLLDELRRFVDRRIAELSTEIHATVELADIAEANVTQQLQRMHEQLARLVALPQAASRNSGVELEAVVQETEAAANRIMTAAETIQASVHEGEPADAAAIVEQVNTIFEACSFQDLTGQRIRRALEELQNVEGMIAEMVEHGGEAPLQRAREDKVLGKAEVTGHGPDLAQLEIDRLLAG